MLDAPDANAIFASDIVRADGSSITDTIDQLDNAPISDLNSEWALALPSYSDQVLPFNVTLAGANEYGAMCASKILGIEILNEGSGISVDDAVTESQATFFARAIEPLQTTLFPPVGLCGTFESTTEYSGINDVSSCFNWCLSSTISGYIGIRRRRPVSLFHWL